MKYHSLMRFYSYNEKKRNGISRKDLVAIGKSFSNKNTKQIIDEINDTVQQWNFYADKAGVNKEKKMAIGKTLISMK